MPLGLAPDLAGHAAPRACSQVGECAGRGHGVELLDGLQTIKHGSTNEVIFECVVFEVSALGQVHTQGQDHGPQFIRYPRAWPPSAWPGPYLGFPAAKLVLVVEDLAAEVWAGYAQCCVYYTPILLGA